ncbi:kynureninase [Coemansia reversa NRRL 1564]|uniref:Kynureninase n=1 Tax=Coemansia reversa (strain ATCC 12441 / NRRL 1564) TaxID=763665 RepID=A0A2G5BAV6_COERN|nr:kynureninase [Coemansia reversa NRRL 1564]|eukprot:PIA16141.1 kynureninase [Coemansia reversa NRRL 1564]
MEHLLATASKSGLDLEDLRFAQIMDRADPLARLRNEFAIPTVNQATGRDAADGNGLCVYLCGNSLGLMPKQSRRILNEEMDEWATKGVMGHFHHSKGRPWVGYRSQIVEKMAPIVGAEPVEVGVMNTLTTNLHLLLAAFYRPTDQRYKILIESKAFPSDHYAVESQIKWHGRPADALLLAEPRPGEHTLRTEDILSLIRQEGASIAVVMLSGVQYYTGQVFEMDRITAAAKAAGCVVGWDVTHAAGNVPLSLHDWGVDFACWCSYKYLNSGPGGISCFFVHERYAHDADLQRLTGWWGHDAESRFDMTNQFVPGVGAAGFEVSNTPILVAATLLGSLDVFSKTSMEELCKKSVLLTAYLEYLLQTRIGNRVEIITPGEHRGAQLSLLFASEIFEHVFGMLMSAGVICDERKPNCIRLAPVPLYNTFSDVWWAVDVIHAALYTSRD